MAALLIRREQHRLSIGRDRSTEVQYIPAVRRSFLGRARYDNDQEHAGVSGSRVSAIRQHRTSVGTPDRNLPGVVFALLVGQISERASSSLGLRCRSPATTSACSSAPASSPSGENSGLVSDTSGLLVRFRGDPPLLGTANQSSYTAEVLLVNDSLSSR